MPVATLRRSLLTLPLLLAWAAATVSAQSSKRWSLQGSGIYVGVSGDAFEDVGGGPGAELQLRFTPGRLSVGFGGQYSKHKVDGTTPEVNIDYAGGFIEPRMVFDVGKDSFAPYLAARLAYLEESATVAGISFSASGSQLNAGGGVLVRMSPRVNLDVGATFGRINFGDLEASDGSQSLNLGNAGSGTNLVFRLGLAIGLGK